MSHRTLTAIVAVAILGGCYEAPAPELVQAEARGAATTDPARISYLLEGHDHHEFEFESGPLGAPVSFHPGTRFQGVSVMLTSPVSEVYYRTGALGAWTRLVGTESESEGFHAGYIPIYAPTENLELWSPYPLSFGRLEFHDVATGQALPLDDEEDYVDAVYEEAEVEAGDDDVRRQALALPGPWALSSAALAASRDTYVDYDPPPSWSGGRNCTGGLQPGARELGEFLVRNFKGARYFGGYSCRRVRGGSSMSVHGVGRAIDLFVPLSGGRADNELGDVIANYLVENAEALGVQFIIWDRTKWNASYSGRKDAYYGGEHPHHDHLHIELTEEAARGAMRAVPGPAAPIVFDPPFADDDGNTHLAAIEAVYAAGITRGCDQNPLRYCPTREVTRANAAVMLQRALRLSSVSGDYFQDDDGLGSEPAINALAARGVVTGCGDGTYCPSAPLTRGQLAVMLDRGLELPATSKDYFTDDAGQYYEEAANRVAAAGLTQGCSAQKFCGETAVARDQFASFLARAVGLLPGFDPQPLAYRGHFADDDGHLFEESIDAIAAAGIVKGCQQGTNPRYCPDDPASRAQFATMLVRAFDLPASNTDAFTDDDGTTHEASINAVAAAGITNGCATGRFCPGRNLTRGELAVFLLRAAGLPATTRDYFDDDDGKFYEEAANRLAAAGITSGCGDRRFCGDNATTRGELAAFFARVLGL